MPPIWKILIIGSLCLGLSPSWGEDSSGTYYLPEQPTQVSGESSPKFNSEDQSETVTDLGQVPEKILQEKVLESDLEPIPVKSNSQTRHQEKFEVAPSGISQPTFTPGRALELEKMGILKLPKGISIFRYSHRFIKTQSPLTKKSALSESSVQ